MVPDNLREPALKIVVDRTAAWGHWTAKSIGMNELSYFLCHHVSLSL